MGNICRLQIKPWMKKPIPTFELARIQILTFLAAEFIASRCNGSIPSTTEEAHSHNEGQNQT